MADKSPLSALFQQSDDWEELLRRVIREEVNKAVDEAVSNIQIKAHNCRIKYSDEELHQINNLFASYSIIGDGVMQDGLRTITENHTWLKHQREMSNKVQEWVVKFLVTTALGGVLWAVVAGVKQFLGKGG